MVWFPSIHVLITPFQIRFLLSCILLFLKYCEKQNSAKIFIYPFIHIVYTGGIIFGCRFRGKMCILSKDALKDMINLDVSPDLLETIINEGKDYTDDKMSMGEVGRSIKKRGNIIFVKLVPSYSYSLDENIWLIKHIGKRGK